MLVSVVPDCLRKSLWVYLEGTDLKSYSYHNKISSRILPNQGRFSTFRAARLEVLIWQPRSVCVFSVMFVVSCVATCVVDVKLRLLIDITIC